MHSHSQCLSLLRQFEHTSDGLCEMWDLQAAFPCGPCPWTGVAVSLAFWPSKVGGLVVTYKHLTAKAARTGAQALTRSLQDGTLAAPPCCRLHGSGVPEGCPVYETAERCVPGLREIQDNCSRETDRYENVGENHQVSGEGGT
jgi:hypothetical protein